MTCCDLKRDVAQMECEGGSAGTGLCPPYLGMMGRTSRYRMDIGVVTRLRLIQK